MVKASGIRGSQHGQGRACLSLKKNELESECADRRRETSSAPYLENLRSGCLHEVLWQEVVDNNVKGVARSSCTKEPNATHSVPFVVPRMLPVQAHQSQRQCGGGGWVGQGSDTGSVEDGVLPSRGLAGTLAV